jgi:hypothetical protein
MHPRIDVDDVATRLRQRAAALVAERTATYEDYRQVDEICDQVNSMARKLDSKVLGLALDGLEEPLAQVEAATASMKAAQERIEKLQSSITVGTKLLLAALAVAAMVMDPTRISAIAAAKSIAALAETIADVATKE